MGSVKDQAASLAVLLLGVAMIWWGFNHYSSGEDNVQLANTCSMTPGCHLNDRHGDNVAFASAKSIGQTDRSIGLAIMVVGGAGVVGAIVGLARAPRT